MSPRPTHRLQLLIHCAGCLVAGPIRCPSCGSGHLWQLYEAPARLPCPLDDRSCSDCGARLLVDLLGWAERPAAAPDRPAHRSPLSDALPGLERAWRKGPGRRERKPAAARVADARQAFPADRTPRPKRPPAPPKPAPCPADAERYRLAVWDAWGCLPDGVAPSAIAAAYRRRFGVEPRRDAACKTFRAYSRRELEAALSELRWGVGR